MLLAEVDGLPVSTFTPDTLDTYFTTLAIGSTVDLAFRPGPPFDVRTTVIGDLLPAYP